LDVNSYGKRHQLTRLAREKKHQLAAVRMLVQMADLWRRVF
jgi:hypothetical protein